MVDSKHEGLFRIDRNQYLIFNAGFKDLGDIKIILTLTDSNPKPKSTNYQILVTVLPSEFSEMENTNVQKNNDTQFQTTLIGSNSTDKFKTSQVTPTGELTFDF